jgi:hypothetical protein
MKYAVHGLLVFLIFLVLLACRKTSFINSPDAAVAFSADTLHFDTVFTTTGSVTQSFKIFNDNNQKLRLSQVKLMGGSSSAFKMNVDGTPATRVSDIELEPNDSIYVFVSVSINPNSSNLPFVVQDSILVNYNGTDRFVQLQAYGQNANFFRNRRITRDTTWKSDLPFVILDKVTIDSSTSLTIEKGCRIYLHADAPFIVNGSLKVNGDRDATSRVTFQGDRIDPDYRDLPGAWPGIFFSSSSIDNVLTYAIIKNAYQGIITVSTQTANPKVVLDKCVVDNVYDAGILSVASSIKATNCLISNCGSNIFIAGGGLYSFTHCTVATYGNLFIDHKKPVLSVSNAYDQNQIFPLNALFTNCIFYGEGLVDDEIQLEKKGAPNASDYSVVFQNILYKNKNDQSGATFNNCLKNQAPQFDSIDAGRRYFDLHLKPTSPAINAGIVTGVTTDLDGRSRVSSGLPDLGCYEHR